MMKNIKPQDSTDHNTDAHKMVDSSAEWIEGLKKKIKKLCEHSCDCQHYHPYHQTHIFELVLEENARQRAEMEKEYEQLKIDYERAVDGQTACVGELNWLEAHHNEQIIEAQIEATEKLVRMIKQDDSIMICHKKHDDTFCADDKDLSIDQLFADFKKSLEKGEK
jgi:hypothetical protein